VKIVNAAGATLIKNIVTGTDGFRTDEGCYDPDDHLMLFVNGESTPPYATFISTTSQTIVSTISFSGAQFGAGEAGLDACVYDHNTKNFYVNNDGTTTNTFGELDVITAASAVAGTPVVSAQYDEGTGAQGSGTNDCNPSGIALNPSNDALVIACDTNAGNPQETLIMSAVTGAVLAAVTGVGGSDEAAYDPFLGRFYVAARDMTATGISQTVRVHRERPDREGLALGRGRPAERLRLRPSPADHELHRRHRRLRTQVTEPIRGGSVGRSPRFRPDWTRRPTRPGSLSRSRRCGCRRQPASYPGFAARRRG
jgi:hypothetical protein